MLEISQMLKGAERSVVQIWNPCSPMNGSGFICDPRGYAITTEEVVGHATEVTVVLDDGTSVRGTVVGRDELSGLAVVRFKADTSLVALDLDVLGNPCEGENIVALGFNFVDTLRNENPTPTLSATQGVISNVIKGTRFNIVKYSHENRSMDPGVQGGPLLDRQGHLVGISAWPPFLLPGYAVEGGGHAHSVQELRALLPSLMEGSITIRTSSYVEARGRHQVYLNGICESKIRHCLREHVQDPLAGYGHKPKEGAWLRYCFKVNDPEEKGLDVNYKLVDPSGRVVTFRESVKSDVGTVIVTHPGTYTLEFDNSFSWFTGKYMALCYGIVQPGYESPDMGNRFWKLAKQNGIETGEDTL